MIASLRRVLLLALPLLALGGCLDAGGPATTAPRLEAGAPARSVSPGKADLSPLARFRTRPVITIAWAKKWIGPEGGRLEFNGFAIDVPAGAVQKVTQFSIRVPVDPDGSDHVLAEFGPHGATFAQPVTIELPYANTTLYGSATATVLWWNPDASAWQSMGRSVTADGARVSAQTGHFSTFGFGEQQASYTGTFSPSGG